MFILCKMSSLSRHLSTQPPDTTSVSAADSRSSSPLNLRTLLRLNLAQKVANVIQIKGVVSFEKT